MRIRHDSLAGKNLFRLTFEKVIRGKTGTKLQCLCDCGKTTLAFTSNVLSGHTKSCGCFGVEVATETNTVHGHTGKNYQSPEFRTWSHMKSRCLNSKVPNFKNYGGRGIKVCKRWLNSFQNFLDDMGEKPTSLHSIGRIDNDGNYEPSNCRWETAKQQAENTRTNRRFSVNGESKTVSQWSESEQIHSSTLRNRLLKQWPERILLNTPTLAHKPIKHSYAHIQNNRVSSREPEIKTTIPTPN